MLLRDARIAILELHRRGRGCKRISHELGLARNTVREVVRSGEAERPEFQRVERLDPHLDLIRELHERCEGNLVRVHEELGRTVQVAYPTLTDFCRRRGIGGVPKQPAGRYHFKPGEEMQHDTSPHDVLVGGRRRRLQCASVVLCHSRMMFGQLYPTFDRFTCKAFLTEGALFFGATADRCMVDNSHVVIAHGTGKDAVIAPEMVAFGKRFGFHFEAHEKGDANRSARVELSFSYVEGNFYKGRTFADLPDLNAQFRAWCEKSNGSYKKTLKASPVSLFAEERPYLHRLPDWVPEVVRVETRRVDVEACISLHTNRYSVPDELIDATVEVHETLTRVRILHRHKIIADHVAAEPGADVRITDPTHRRPRGKRLPEPPSPEECELRAAGPAFAAMLERLKRGRARQPILRFHRLYVDYPTEALQKALVVALDFGLHDLGRIERMVLRSIAGEVFRLPVHPEEKP